MVILALILTVAFYATSQLLNHGKFRWSKPGFGFWDESSDRRKYKLPLRPKPDTPYYRFFKKVKYEERFPFSATILVGFTDGYHLTQHLAFISLALAVSSNFTDFLVYWRLALIAGGIILGTNAFIYWALSKKR